MAVLAQMNSNDVCCVPRLHQQKATANMRSRTSPMLAQTHLTGWLPCWPLAISFEATIAKQFALPQLAPPPCCPALPCPRSFDRPRLTSGGGGASRFGARARFVLFVHSVSGRRQSRFPCHHRSRRRRGGQRTRPSMGSQPCIIMVASTAMGNGEIRRVEMGGKMAVCPPLETQLRLHSDLHA